MNEKDSLRIIISLMLMPSKKYLVLLAVRNGHPPITGGINILSKISKD